MGQKGKPTSLEERIEMGERWKEGQNDPEIAKAMGRSVWTIRKWRRAYQREGRSGMSPKMGRPPIGALGQYSSEMRQEISAMREAHPGWGPITILTELEKDPVFSEMKMPSRSSVASYLKQENYTRKYEKHSELPQPKEKKAKQAHEIWEVDAQGKLALPELGTVSIINIKDLLSRLYVMSYPSIGTSHPGTKDYQLAFRMAFMERGLPEKVSFDHDSVFYDNASKSPYPSKLHLWLIALGISVRFIEKKPPAEHSVIERSHQTIEKQALDGQSFANNQMLEKSLAERRKFLNSSYPSRSLDGKTPLEAYPEAVYSKREYRIEWEEDLLDMSTVFDYLSQGRWFRQTSSQGQFSLGANRYNIGYSSPKQTLEITFDSRSREFLCLSEDGENEFRFPAKGLTKDELMNEINPFLNAPEHQLKLPFSMSAWREAMIATEIGGTTLSDNTKSHAV
jgi:transposase